VERVGRLDGPERAGSFRILVDALEQVQALRDTHGRRLCLEIVDRYLGFPLQVTESASTRMHLFDIVLVCRRHPRALVTLAAVLEEIEPGSPAVRRVRRIVDDMSALDLIPAEQREELLELMAGSAGEHLADLVREAAGPAAAELPIDRRKPEDALLFLEQLNAGADGVPPLLIFVEYLAGVVGDHRCEQLREWNDRQARRMGMEHDVRKLRLERPSPAGGPGHEPIAYLVIRLEPDPLEEDGYAGVWWQQVDRGRWHPRRGETFGGDLENIRRKVSELIEDAETGWAKEASAIRVDFLLPFALLNLPVDQWDLETDSGLPRLLGLHYEVVLRSLDRARTPKWHREWRRRWKLLEELRRDGGGVSEEFWLWSAASKPHQLVGLDATLALRRNVLSLVLRSQPPVTEAGEVLIGLRTGVPVMIWHRSDGARSAFDAAVSGMREQLCHLPRSARLLRGAAKLSPRLTHVGNRISLMWDDPDRPVEPVDLAAAPSKEVSA